MQRKFLEELGLEKEVIDKIMDENGKDIEGEKSKLTTKEKELELVNNQLTEANKAIKSYKDMNIDDIKKSADDWAEKYKSLEVELKDTKNSATLEKELLKSNPQDVSLILAVLDREKLKFEEDKVDGLEEQIKSLKENKPYLFKEEISTNKNGYEPYVPKNSNTDTNNDDLKNMVDAVFDN